VQLGAAAAEQQCNLGRTAGRFLKHHPRAIQDIDSFVALAACGASSAQEGHVHGADALSPALRLDATPDFGAPFSGQERLRSPMRNTDLAATQTSLREHYASSYNRVGE
jgi:hypothetical protein